MKKIPLLVLAMTLAAPVCASAGPAGTWPQQPITLVVPFPAGGTTDLLARLVARETSMRLHQNVVVENRPGAGGNIGAAAVARARPDGYTLLMGTVGTQVTNQFIYSQMPYDSARDFAPVTLVANSPNVLLVKAGRGFGSVGGTPHLSGELFNRLAGVDIHHVPYKGSALAVTTTTPSPMLPGVPTMEQAGLKGYAVDSWFGLLAPAGTPAPVVKRIRDAVAQALDDPAVRKQVQDLGAIPIADTPEDYARIIRDDTAKWRQVIQDAHIRM